MSALNLLARVLWFLASLDPVKNGLARGVASILSPSALLTLLLLAHHFVSGSLTVLLLILLALHVQLKTPYIEPPRAASSNPGETRATNIEAPDRPATSWFKIIFMLLAFAFGCSVGTLSTQRVVIFGLFILFWSNNRRDNEDFGDADITLVDDKSLDGSIHISATTLDLSQSVSVSLGGLQLEAKFSIPVAAESKPLNPLVAPFVPPTHVVKIKNDWNPPRPLSFQWARGGCRTRITPLLDASASEFVPKNRAAVSVVEGLCGQHTIPAKKAIIFRRAPPSFWSPGGRAIPIVPPIDA